MRGYIIWHMPGSFIESDLLQPRSVTVDRKQIEIWKASIRGIYVRCENDLLTVGMKIRRKVRSFIGGKLPFLSFVGLHDHDLEL